MMEKLISAALDLVQKRGYNAVSYRDLAERVGIRTASIHYYFPSKGDLGEALMKHYRQVFARALNEIDANTSDPNEKLRLYAGLFERTFEAGQKVCLGGMLATEFLTLPEPVRGQVRGFFADNEAWLVKVIRSGKESGSFDTKAPPESLATTVVSALEGGMMAARAFRDPGRLSAVAVCVRRLLQAR